MPLPYYSLDPTTEQLPTSVAGSPAVPPTGGPLPPAPAITPPPLGGPTPPVAVGGGAPVAMPPLGGPLPPAQVAMPPLGGNTPAVPVAQLPPLGGNTPPSTVSGLTNVTPPPLSDPYPAVPAASTTDAMPPLGGNNPPVPAGPSPGNFGPAQTVQDMINALMNGEYGANAARRGFEQAGSRGLSNSSIAVGASRRAALEAIQPFVNEGMGLLKDREGRAFQSQENQLERLFRQQLQNDSVLQQNWLANQQFNNRFNAEVAMLPVNNSLQMLQLIMQAGVNDPEVFTPQVMSGLGNFFNNNMLTMLRQYFPQNFAGQAGGA